MASSQDSREPTVLRRLWRGMVDLGAIAAAVAGTAFVAKHRLPSPANSSGGGAGPDRPPTEATEAASPGYERSDISARGTAMVMAVFATTVALLIAGIFGVIALFHNWDQVARLPLTQEQTTSIPAPPPRLQAHPYADLAAVQAHADALLGSYAWLGPDHARARIPIDRAITAVVGRPLDAPP